jgi:hypothetical protein
MLDTNPRAANESGKNHSRHYPGAVSGSMFMTQNGNASLRYVFDQQPETHGLNLIHRCMLNEWIVILNRMLEDKKSNDRASIKRICDFFEKDEKSQQEIIKKARGWNDRALQLADYNERLVVRNSATQESYLMIRPRQKAS